MAATTTQELVATTNSATAEMMAVKETTQADILQDTETAAVGEMDPIHADSTISACWMRRKQLQQNDNECSHFDSKSR